MKKMKNVYLGKSPENLKLENLEKRLPEINENTNTIPTGYVWEYGVGLIENPENKLLSDLEFIKNSRGLIYHLTESLSLKGIGELFEDISDLNSRFLTYDSRVEQRRDLLLDSIKKSRHSLLNYINDANSNEQLLIGNFLSSLSKISKKLSPQEENYNKTNLQKHTVHPVHKIRKEEIDMIPGIGCLSPISNSDASFMDLPYLYK